MSPVLRDQPFDLALWATLSFMRPTHGLWSKIISRLVNVDDLVRAARFLETNLMRRL